LFVTLDPSKRTGLPPGDAKFLKSIEEFGWHVMSVAPLAGDEGDLWAYSTGLFYSHDHPEVIVFNLDLDSLPNAVNSIGTRVKAGEKFEVGKSYTGIFDDRECQFRWVDKSQYKEYLGFSLWFYEGWDFPVLQAFWPDEDNRYPWTDGGDGWIRQTQPLLYEELPSA
jgi:Domain of unknown function (DUF4262)